MDYKRLFLPNSLVFITVVTKYRQEILIKNISYLRKAFITAQFWHKFQIVAIIVNQDHFHMIPVLSTGYRLPAGPDCCVFGPEGGLEG